MHPMQLIHHQANNGADSHFRRHPSGGHHHVITGSRYDTGLCSKPDVEEASPVLEDTDSGPWNRGIENCRGFDLELKKLGCSCVENKEYHQSFSANGYSEFTSGIENPKQGVTWLNDVWGVALKVEVLFGLALQFQFKWDDGSRERRWEMGTTFPHWMDWTYIQNFVISAQDSKF